MDLVLLQRAAHLSPKHLAAAVTPSATAPEIARETAPAGDVSGAYALNSGDRTSSSHSAISRAPMTTDDVHESPSKQANGMHSVRGTALNFSALLSTESAERGDHAKDRHHEASASSKALTWRFEDIEQVSNTCTLAARRDMSASIFGLMHTQLGCMPSISSTHCDQPDVACAKATVASPHQ